MIKLCKRHFNIHTHALRSVRRLATMTLEDNAYYISTSIWTWAKHGATHTRNALGILPPRHFVNFFFVVFDARAVEIKFVNLRHELTFSGFYYHLFLALAMAPAPFPFVVRYAIFISRNASLRVHTLKSSRYFISRGWHSFVVVVVCLLFSHVVSLPSMSIRPSFVVIFMITFYVWRCKLRTKCVAAGETAHMSLRRQHNYADYLYLRKKWQVIKRNERVDNCRAPSPSTTAHSLFSFLSLKKLLRVWWWRLRSVYSIVRIFNRIDYYFISIHLLRLFESFTPSHWKMWRMKREKKNWNCKKLLLRCNQICSTVECNFVCGTGNSMTTTISSERFHSSRATMGKSVCECRVTTTTEKVIVRIDERNI